MTPTQRKAMEQALEALEEADSRDEYRSYGLEITALRAALMSGTDGAEQQSAKHGEPVAHLYRDHNGELRLNCIKPVPYFAFPVYTAPQPAKQPLTDGEIIDVLWARQQTKPFKTHAEDRMAFARAIERAHGINVPQARGETK